jgi:integrase
MIRKKYIPGGSLPECVDSYLFRQGIKLMTGQIKNKQRGVAAKTKAEWGYTLNNPVKNVKKVPMQASKVRFFDKKELALLLNKTSGVWREFVVMAINTGMRRGEILKLTWHDINMSERIISVPATKTYKLRHIPINNTLYDFLVSKKEKAKSEYVIAYPDAEPVSPVVASRYFGKIMKRLKIKNASIHTLRHTFASYLVMGGVDIISVKELLGHSDLRMTQIYAHLRPGYLQNTVTKLDGLLTI